MLFIAIHESGEPRAVQAKSVKIAYDLLAADLRIHPDDAASQFDLWRMKAIPRAAKVARLEDVTLQPYFVAKRRKAG